MPFTAPLNAGVRSLIEAASMSHRKLLSLIILFVLLLYQACMPPECKNAGEFFNLSPDARDRVFKTYDLDKQLDIYHCGMRLEPPQMGFAYDIAARGELALPPLLERLQAEKNERRQKDIILIFEVLAVMGHLGGRKDIAVQIRRTVNAMRIPEIKSSAEEMADEIENDTK